MRVGVLGAQGRMGGEVCRAVEAAPDLELVGARRPRRLARPRWPTPGRRSSSTSPIPTWCSTTSGSALDAGIAVVVGTSGFDEERFGHRPRLAGRRPRGRCAGRAELRHRRGADDALRPDRRAVLRRPSRSSSCTTPARSTRRRGPRPAPPRCWSQERAADAARARPGRDDAGAGRGARRRRRRDPGALGAAAAAWSPTRRCCSARTGELLTIRHDSMDRTLVHARRPDGGARRARPARADHRAGAPARPVARAGSPVCLPPSCPCPSRPRFQRTALSVKPIDRKCRSLESPGLHWATDR